MSNPVSRRKLITGGIAAAAGVSGIAVAANIASRYGLIPPDSGGIWGVGETLTYATQHLLMSHHSLAREFNRSEVSKVVPVSGNPPETEPYARLRAGGFADWRLAVGGMVARPYAFSLAELKRMPVRSQITHQACEEGWSFIAEWTGVPSLSCSESGRESAQKPNMSSLFLTMRLGTASIWPTRSIPRRFLPTDSMARICPRPTVPRFACASPASSATRA